MVNVSRVKKAEKLIDLNQSMLMEIYEVVKEAGDGAAPAGCSPHRAQLTAVIDATRNECLFAGNGKKDTSVPGGGRKPALLKSISDHLSAQQLTRKALLNALKARADELAEARYNSLFAHRPDCNRARLICLSSRAALFLPLWNSVSTG